MEQGAPSEYIGTAQHYFVAVIDLLSQSRNLSGWCKLPKNETEQQAFETAVVNSYGRVASVRRHFVGFLNAFLEGPEILAEMARTSGEDHRSVRERLEVSIKFKYFSDTLVAYSPIKNQFGHSTVFLVCGFLRTVGGLLLLNLAEGTPLRGGIDVGVAAIFPEDEFYGPVLASAHHLESRVAKYPRIVIGDELLSYLEAHAHSGGDSALAEFNQKYLGLAGSFICVDEFDGKWIVDYLGDAFLKVSKDHLEFSKVCAQAFHYAQQQLANFKSANDVKLAPRYQALVDYFSARKFD